MPPHGFPTFLPATFAKALVASSNIRAGCRGAKLDTKVQTYSMLWESNVRLSRPFQIGSPVGMG